VKTKTTIIFDIGLLLKLIDSLFEVIGGFLLLSPVKVSGYLELLSQHSKHDFISRNLDKLASSVHQATIVMAAYLIVHGMAKAILIGGALKRKTWGYIGLMIVLAIFSIMEVTRYFETQKIGILIFGLFDGALVGLIAHEYQARYKQNPETAKASAP
jgi:uncharacterized membrane protein